MPGYSQMFFGTKTRAALRLSIERLFPSPGVSVINTPLQWGVESREDILNRFSGFSGLANR
jgi:hypothetical protein